MIVTKSYTFTGDVPIPDFSVDPNGISNVLKVIGIPDGVEIKHIAVNLNVDHTWDADLDISLIDPQGTTIDLSSDNGGPGDNYTNTTFDDGATNAPIKGLATGLHRSPESLSRSNRSLTSIPEMPKATGP